MATTMKKNLVIPEVMADMISATLPKMIKFKRIAKLDDTLVGQPGDTITVPKYAYIGDAEDVAEGVAMGTTVLTASTTKATVKKAGKAVELTDESVLSGYGDPMGEANGQLTMSIAAKVDNDCYDTLATAKLVSDKTAGIIGYDAIVDANALFEDESDNALQKVLYIHPLQEAQIRKDPNFMDKNKYGLDVVMDGTIGKIAGCEVVKSKKVKLVKYKEAGSGSITIVADSTSEDGTNIHLSTALAHTINTKKPLKVGDKLDSETSPYYACPIVVVDAEDPNNDPGADGFSVNSPALTIYLKRDAEVESDRDILKKTTVISADEHFTVVLSNDSKVVLAKFKAEA